jgi:phage N-6-adenine-methyltransferase
MGKMDVHFSSATGEWETPQGFFDKLDKEFVFSLDVCATGKNSKCKYYIDKEADGLDTKWDEGVWFCNPPYGRGIGKWVKKAVQESLLGNSGVMLLPARTDTKWFSYIWNHKTHRPRKWVREVRFIKGRLKFGGAKSAAPFPSVVVVFGRPK